MYFQITPYAANTPVNAIDPDGHLVIFVNGQNAGTGGTPAYWGGFSGAVQRHFNDYNQNYEDHYLSGGSTDIYTKGAVTIALAMKKDGISVEQIAKFTKLSVEEIEKL